MSVPNYFTATERKCRCGCGLDLDPEFLRKLNRVRHKYGKPVRMNSGARCPEYNNEVSSTGLDGPHTTRRAADLGVSGYEVIALAWAAIRVAILDRLLGRGQFTGFGLKQSGPHGSRFVHVDDLPEQSGRPRPWVWTY